MPSRLCRSVLVLGLLTMTPALASEQDIKQNIEFARGYNAHIAPVEEEGQPLDVEVSANLRNILLVDEINQFISLEMSLRMYWRDPRLSLKRKALNATVEDYVTLKPEAIGMFWVPDIFIDKAKVIRSPTYLTPPASLRLYPGSSLLRYSSRINFDVACDMEYNMFPNDFQECEIKFESFGHTNKQLNFTWKDENLVDENIQLKQFFIDVEFQDTYKTDYYDQAYPGVIMRIRLARQIGYHIVQTYIPSVIFVLLAWLSMFIPPESIPGRVGMGMTTLLTLTAMFGSVRNNVPKVSYITFLDIWMLTSIIFVFSCIFEFMIVNYFMTKGKKNIATYVERISWLFIAVAYLTFNLVYWPLLFAT